MAAQQCFQRLDRLPDTRDRYAEMAANVQRRTPMFALARSIMTLGVLVGSASTAWGHDRRPFSSPSAATGGRVYGQAIGVTSIVFGERPIGEPQIILFSGLLEITKSAVTTNASGRRQIAIKFDSLTPSGARIARSAATTAG